MTQHPSTTTIDPRVMARLRETDTGGLADTLSALVGRRPNIQALASGPGGPQGMIVNDSTFAIDAQLPNTAFTNTLIHEFGHMFAGTKATSSQAESKARAFERAILGLRGTVADTTNTIPFLRALSRGQRFSPRGATPLEPGAREQPGTIAALLELLDQPIFAKHPLQTRIPEIRKAFQIPETGK